MTGIYQVLVERGAMLRYDVTIRRVGSSDVYLIRTLTRRGAWREAKRLIREIEVT